MSAKGFVLAEEGHVVLATAPIDITAGGTSDVWSMGDYAHASIIVSLGVTGAASTITVEECDNFTPSTHPAIAFSYYAETTAGGDTLGARTAATTSGFATSTNDGVFYVIEVDASQLSDGFPNMRLSFSAPSSTTLASITVILSGSRYAEEQSATAIA